MEYEVHRDAWRPFSFEVWAIENMERIIKRQKN